MTNTKLFILLLQLLKGKLASGYIPEGLTPRHTSARGNIQVSLLNIKHKCVPMQNNPKLNGQAESKQS
jgi:hypothetical protein